MMERELILVTNDDGIYSKGIDALIRVAQEFGDVVVVAPEMGMSGMSHSITMYKPLFLRKVAEEEGVVRYACEGTPVDCIKLAVDAVMKRKPTLVLSGINHGANTNLSVIYSGTMGGATEASTYKIPSIGFSLVSHDTSSSLDAATHYAREIIKMVLRNRHTTDSVCLNVNIPNLELSEIKGVKFCRQTQGYWKEDFEKRFDPHGREYYWLVGRFINEEPETSSDNDEWAIKNGYIAIVPVKVDMTDYTMLNIIKTWE